MSGPASRRGGGAPQRGHRLTPERSVQTRHDVGPHEVELPVPRPPTGRSPGGVPPRSPVGVASAATASPTTAGPDPLNLRQERQRREVVGQRRDRQADRSRGPAAHAAAARGASCSAAPSETWMRTTSPRSAPGTCARSVGRDHALAAVVEPGDQHRPAVGVELAHHVVEEHQRRRAPLGGQRLALGHQQREQGDPLLALGAVGAQLAAVAPDDQVVAVRTVAREAAIEV